MQAVRHENINRAQSPCEEDPQYNFAHCIEKSVAIKAGCQPHWNKFNVSEVPFCLNASMLKKYSDVSNSFSKMYKKELLEKTKCLIPCTFTEYKVTIYLFNMFNIF